MKLENIRDHEHSKCPIACVSVSRAQLEPLLFDTLCDGANGSVRADQHEDTV